jgi:hypothetical protein
MTNIITENQINNILDTMASDYANWCSSGPYHKKEGWEEIRDGYRKTLTFKIGRKYIKLLHLGTTVNGFIVAVKNDKKFAYGDLLMAANWTTPARNFPRGNVFANDLSRVRWTGIG